MRMTQFRIAAGTLSFVILAFCASLASAETRSKALPVSKLVNVNVTFSMELPLPDESEEVMASTQEAGRKLIYEFVKSECAVLKKAIAEACRLTSLNVSTKVRRQKGRMPALVFLNGRAQFAISLKDDDSAAP